MARQKIVLNTPQLAALARSRSFRHYENPEDFQALWRPTDGHSDYMYQTLNQIGAMFAGDHVEIGTRHGRSAAAVAAYRRNGIVVCIDPMQDLEVEGTPRKYNDNHSDRLFANMRRLGLKIELVQAYSTPWPLPAFRRFTTALMDGDHMAPQPLKDWEALSLVVDNIVLVDDIDQEGVWPAVEAIVAHEDWDWHRLSGFIGYARRKDGTS